MGHRQYGDNSLIRGERQHAAGELHVDEQSPVGNHHTLGVTSGTGGVVQYSQVLTRLLGLIHYAVSTESIRVFPVKMFIQILKSLVKGLGTTETARHIVHQDYAGYIWHLLRNHSRKNHIAHNQKLGLRVVHKCMHVRGLEVVQDGNGHCTVC